MDYERNAWNMDYCGTPDNIAEEKANIANNVHKHPHQ